MQLSNKLFYVYRWIRLDTNTPFYVGKGSGSRYKDIKNGRNNYFLSIIKKVKCKSEIIFNTDSEQEAYRMEEQLIRLYKKYELCKANLCDGGKGGTKGAKRSPEAIEKTRLSNLGRKCTPEAIANFRSASLRRVYTGEQLARMSALGRAQKGRIDSVETKLKKSKASKGKKKSIEHILNMSKVRKGKSVSEETRRKISESNKGANHCHSKIVVNIITGESWGNVRIAAESNKLNYSTLRSRLNGRYKNNTDLRYK